MDYLKHLFRCCIYIVLGLTVLSDSTSARGPSTRSTSRPSMHKDVQKSFIPMIKSYMKSTKKRILPIWKSLQKEYQTILRQWIQIAQIPAPSKHEHRRGRWIANAFRAAGLQVRIDRLGNVMGTHVGLESKKHKQIVLMAHLDTVFPASLSHRVRRHKHILKGLGITDDSSGLIALVTLARMFHNHTIRLKRDVVFVASVQEEIGLIGAQFFVRNHRKRLAAVVSLDGSWGGVSYGALGIEWYKVTFSSPAFHTLSSYKKPSTTHAIADFIRRVYALPLIRHPFMKRTWLNVGKVGGGRVVNAQAPRSWCTLDLRSMDAKRLQQLRKVIRVQAQAVARAHRVKFDIKTIQIFPAAQLPYAGTSKLVQAAKWTLKSMGVQRVHLSPMGSSDHAAAVVQGIPGINIGVVRGGGIHSRKEWADTRFLLKGLQHVAWLTVLLAELP